MANSINEDPCSLNGAVAQSLSSTASVDGTNNEQADSDGVHEEVLHHFRQALADANTFDSTSLNYAVAGEEPQVCDTGQGAPNGEIGIAEVASGESDMVTNSESILEHTSEVIFSDGAQDSMLTNGSSGVLDIDANGSYSVETIPEGHVISIPSDMITDSAIITESIEDHSQNSIEISESSHVQLLQEGNHQQLDIVGHAESGDYEQHTTEVSTLQPDLNTSQEVLHSGSFSQAHHAITLSAPSGISMTPEVLQSVLEQVRAQHLVQQQEQSVNVQPLQIKEEPTTIAVPISTSSSSVNFTVVSVSQSTATTNGSVSTTTSVTPGPAPPLGSSQNPIRIIQQGNRYTPVQQLSTEQLQQIMQVVQQQHVNKNTQDTSGAIIFNPQTNTRIMYRVIYPSELHKSQNLGGQTTYQVVRPAMATQEQQTGVPHQKRPYRRRKDLVAATVPTLVGTGAEQEEKDKVGGEGPELSKEEKEERKKHRPRTRSGRVSKPPKHMVQDYKHIHVLDWDEDYDDSDGGYSDFKHSDEEGKVKQEGAEEEQLPKSPDLFSGLGAVRPKNHKCQSCDKSYIGQAGLARHYRLNPDHCINPSEDGSSFHNGSIDGDDNSKDIPLAQENSLSRLSDSALDTTATPGGPNSGSTNLETFSEDSNTQDSLNSTEAPSPHTVLGPGAQRGRGRGRFRGRWAHLKYNAHMRRKNKLKELIKQCSDEELMEVVLPRLVTSISLWEFLMMKSEKGGARPQVDGMYHEFELLSKHVRQACSSYLQPLSEEELTDDSLQCKMIKVSDKKLGVCLDLEPVTYRVREMPSSDCNSFSSFHNKLSAAAMARSQQETESVPLSKCLETDRVEIRLNGGLKRPLDSDVSAEDELHNPAKRHKISTLPIPTVVSPGLFTVKAHLPPQGNCIEGDRNPQEVLPSDPPELFSCSQQASLSNHTALQVVVTSQDLVATSAPSSSLLSSSLSIPSSSSSLPLITKAITTSAGSSTQSPFVHIASPATKQQIGHNTTIINGDSSFSTPLSLTRNVLINTANNSNQAKPRAMAVTAGRLQTNPAVNGTTSNTLPPVVAGSGVGMGAQRFLLAGPGAQTILAQQGAGPGTALLLAAGAAAGNHRILVRHPAPVVATSQKQPQQNKINSQAAASTAFTSLLAASSTATTKPTEVKVSRQLFHNATQSSTSSLLGLSKTTSLLTNGKAPVSNVMSAPLANPHPTQVTVSPVLNSYVLDDASVVNNQVTISKEIPLPVKFERNNSKSSNKTLETPPSGQQFVTSPNKTASTTNHVGMSVVIGAPQISDIDVMGLELPVVDGINSSLGPTPTDSFNDSFASSSSSVVTTMIAGSHFLNGGSVADSILSYHKPNGDVFVTSNPTSSLISSTSDPSNHSQPQSSLSSDNIATSLPVHDNQKSSVFSNNKVNTKQAVTESVVPTNGTLFSQSVQADNSSLHTNLSDLQFSHQSEEIPPEAAPDQFTNGTITPMDHTTDMSSELETVDAALPEEMSLNNHLTEEEIDQEGISNTAEALVSNDSSQQLLLSEGTNIYQTEDGIFIESANGNTYQLQGAHGLSMEAVQALLSGTLDQLAS